MNNKKFKYATKKLYKNMPYFDETCECLQSVFKNKKEHLKYFEKVGNFGWEKWLQMEMATDLSRRGHISEVEKRYSYDRRTNVPAGRVNYSNCFIDLAFKRKNYTNDWFSAIELKVTKGIGGMRSVLADLEKISSIKVNEWDIRSVTGILVAGKNERETKFSKIANEINSHKNINHRVERMDLLGTNFEVLIFGWEVGSTGNMNRDSYKQWLRTMREVYKSNEVHLIKL